MSEITVEVVEDADRPEGGHAVIRLNGLWLLPTNATFRIEPMDGSKASEGSVTADFPDADWPENWPRGDRVPLATRLTPQGVEIVVGPDIVESPALLPGTPVVVAVPAAFVRAETLWPELAVSEPAAAPPVVLTAAELAAELEAVAEANRRREEEAALLAIQRQIAEADRAEASAGVTDATSEPPHHPLSNGRDPTPQLAVLVSANAGAVPGSGAAVNPAAGAPKVAAHDTAPVTAGRLFPEPPKGTALTPGGARDLVPQAPRAVTGPAAQRSQRTWRVGAPFALGFLLAAGLTAIVALRQGGWGQPPVMDAPPVATFSDMLAVAAVSPRGRNAAEVDLPTALKLADESLHMTVGGPDQAEASFWLRKAMALSVGTPQLSWTLTQLGTLYAQPASGPADFGKARLLWELAGASGDATALCFLGALYEHGLGVARSNRQALGYYQRAKARGGCADVDGAIARVRN